MAVYEGMFILDPAKFSRDPGAAAQQVADLITGHGGTVLAARLWDERKLAYPIKGHKKGIYWLTYFKMPGGNLTALERQCEITDEIIRKSDEIAKIPQTGQVGSLNVSVAAGVIIFETVRQRSI